MGQKVNPHGLRVGVIKDWDSQWFVDKKEVAFNIKEDNDMIHVHHCFFSQMKIHSIPLS